MEQLQLTIEQAQHAGRMAALQAAEHADREMEDWSTEASCLLIDFARDIAAGQPFLLEDAREWAERGGFPQPPDRRAWGHIALAMKRAGHITPCGYAPARTSRGGPKTLWRLA